MDKEYKSIKGIMDNPELADEMEKVHPGIKAEMAGYLMHPWLPAGMGRKVLMFAIAVFVILLAIVFDNKLFYLLLFVLVLFSPRATGELLSFYGKLFH
jgi:hypothetical protein